MANQPPNRPWFRLASIARPAPPMAPAPAPAPAPPMAPAPAPPQPRPSTVSLGAFRNPQEPRVGSVPTSPVVSRPQVINAPSSPAIKTNNSPLPSKSLSPPSSPSPSPSPVRKTATSSLPSSPAPTSTSTYSPPKVVAATTTYSPPKVVAATTTTTTSLSSPIKTPPRSPVSKQIAPPPSPLVLPPSQAETRIPPEAEQKTVLVQKTVERNNKHGIGNGKQAGGEGKEKLGSKKQQEMGMRVITIAGENRGAYMELNNKKHQPSTGNDKDNKGMHRNGNMPMRSFTNSNVQGINNSIVFNASCKDNNPGVHLTLSRKGNGIYSKEHVNGHHMS